VARNVQHVDTTSDRQQFSIGDDAIDWTGRIQALE
jgi:hypothetical protein